MSDLKQAVAEIKKAILSSQYQAAKMTNSFQLSLYFSIGRYVSVNTRNKTWGSGAIEKISEHLQRELPGLRGFSAENIKKMRTFYEAWNTVLAKSQNSVAMATEFKNNSNIDIYALVDPNRSPQATEFNLQEFLSLGFSLHMEILQKTKTQDERYFYIHQTVVNSWGKYQLRDYLKADVFRSQGKLPNNFSNTISPVSQTLQAIEMFKDEYLLDYINVEELGERDKQDVNERVIENGIVLNVKRFIQQLGPDFCFIGQQYRMAVEGEEFFVDLLFFNRSLRRLVAFELKKGAFKPSYLGQLNFYLTLLDKDVKQPDENPSIGVILCKEANRSVVELAVRDFTKPMG
ncbi:MAG: DUF1016 family protein, partial [Paludibacteraceae bacterium]|nr:DUF1016 family protein [Paludibacteraceae bacterium]